MLGRLRSGPTGGELLATRPRNRLAFTLVELLVVIAIIGTLVGLLLPAVQKARESSRRSTCLNNERQLILATQEYEGRYRRYPGLFEDLSEQHLTSTDAIPNTTWAVLLLPDLERQAIFDKYAEGVMKGSYIDVFLCPSDGEKSRIGPETSYVANGGRNTSVINQRLSNGPFVNRIYEPDLKMIDGHWVDGREYTLAYTENLDATHYDEIGWNGFWQPMPWDLDVEFIHDKHADRTWNPVFLWSNLSDYQMPVCQDEVPMFADTEDGCDFFLTRRFSSESCPAKPGLNMTAYARPSSLHGGGVNVVFASGRAMFLRQDIAYQVYISLMTPYDKKSDSPDPLYLLEDKDFL